jgi:hypothetical protein
MTKANSSFCTRDAAVRPIYLHSVNSLYDSFCHRLSAAPSKYRPSVSDAQSFHRFISLFHIVCHSHFSLRVMCGFLLDFRMTSSYLVSFHFSTDGSVAATLLSPKHMSSRMRCFRTTVFITFSIHLYPCPSRRQSRNSCCRSQ